MGTYFYFSWASSWREWLDHDGYDWSFAERDRESTSVTFLYKGTNPIVGPTLKTLITSQKAPPLNSFTLGVRSSIYEFVGDLNKIFSP